ncbi:hypothetical protein PHYBLDRAFT_4123, partial [Phycomyces blakesleeanus NRRL 1555(-)]
FCIGALKTLMKQRSAGAFLEPVDPIAYNIPDYFEIVKNPMDLGTIMKKLRNGEYGTILEFSEDIQLMFDNCYLYNNAGDPVCCEAKKLEEVFRKCMKKAPASAVNLNIVSPEPFVSTTPKERSASISSVPETMSETEFKHCETVMKEMKKHKYHDYSWPFVQPVDAEAWGAIDYHDVVKEPMDMSTIEKKLYEHQYHNEDEFRSDFTLMFKNCFAYNPPDHLVHKNGKKFEE